MIDQKETQHLAWQLVPRVLDRPIDSEPEVEVRLGGCLEFEHGHGRTDSSSCQKRVGFRGQCVAGVATLNEPQLEAVDFRPRNVASFPIPVACDHCHAEVRRPYTSSF